MANDKDFILKNAVEVGGPTKVTLGTITSGTLDLSTGNYFAETLAANTTYTISNAGAVQAFQLEVTGGGIGYGVSDAAYDGIHLDTTTTTSTNTYFTQFKSDGSSLYIGDIGNDFIYQYDLSTSWDISTATYASKSLSFTNPFGFTFKPDGTELYVIDSTDIIYQYSLSTAWDISTASFSGSSIDLSSQDSLNIGVAIKPDGTKMYIVGAGGVAVYQYSLSTAWDLSTASYDSVSFSLSSQGANPRSIYFSSGSSFTVFFYSTAEKLAQYSLSAEWDLSTASYDGISFTGFTSQTTFAFSHTFGDNGKKLYLNAVSTGAGIWQYSAISTASITWPTSVEWTGGTAPSAPAAGETDVYTFVTDDSGTSYIGVKTADNLS